jgi:ribonuclease HII
LIYSFPNFPVTPMPHPSLVLEASLWLQGLLNVVGLDEVGRGCLAGPVVAAAVLIPPHCQPIPGVQDSKKLSASKRQHLNQQIRQQATAIAIGAASAREIEQLNILQATYFAMGRALERLAAVTPYDHVLIDGRDPKQPQFGTYTAVIDGDALSYAIACASIVAKVRRDRFMAQLACRHPGYGWEKNAGYGTAQHLQALEKLGITPAHRRTFAPVQSFLGS